MQASRILKPLPHIKMIINIKEEIMENKIEKNINNFNEITDIAWEKIMPLWPLKNLIACNPLHGFENLPLEEALLEGFAHFEQTSLSSSMQAVNRETIKWCQSFYDDGQATIAIPYRSLGFYQAWKKLAIFDTSLHRGNKEKIKWLNSLPEKSEEAIFQCVKKLYVPESEYGLFLTLLLTTLPGWAGYIKFTNEWTQGKSDFSYPISQVEYLAVRIMITCLLYPEAVELINIYKKNKNEANKIDKTIREIENNEHEYQSSLVNKLIKQPENSFSSKTTETKAQVVFCIDVRSEPFRRALEKQGHYDTFGFAGFFGIPTCIDNLATGESYASCPVLLMPKHHVKEKPIGTQKEINRQRKGKNSVNMIKSAYQSLKYTFTTPFALVEILGIWDSVWMALRTFFPTKSLSLKEKVIAYLRPQLPLESLLSYESDNHQGIPFDDQCNYAENALKMMGLTTNFAPLVVFCGHGSSTQNNAYASSLDCGACAGRHGGSNAKILATILNSTEVRSFLKSKNINIPEFTTFIAAEHNTTTDEVVFYINKDNKENDFSDKINKLKNDFEAARQYNVHFRSIKLGYKKNKNSMVHTLKRSADWAETRPEWGLSGNASFIVAPRSLTRDIDLEGRAFMHSYDWEQDPDDASLTTILTAPMVVAQWINTQYLFSTLNNISYGSGSKVTHNIQGKMGIMQGNASDLMPGLPLQSIYKTDVKPYHQILRLLTVVYAPVEKINKIIAAQAVLQKLFKNGWVKLMCIDPKNKKHYHLQRDLSWQLIN